MLILAQSSQKEESSYEMKRIKILRVFQKDRFLVVFSNICSILSGNRSICDYILLFMKQILLVVLLVALTNCCFFNIWKLPKHNFGPLNCKPAPQPQPQPQPAPRPQIEDNRFILTFEYAAREGRHLDDSRGNVLWNGVVVYSVTPCDYEIRTVSIEVKAEREDNVLEFEGSGCQNPFGLTIDNVRLVRKGTSRDLIVNGGFERPCIHEDWIYTERIEGWEGHPLEIGKGKTYNCRWNSQVAELASDKNYRLTQRLHIDLHGCY